MKNALIALIWMGLLAASGNAAAVDQVLVEAESFADPGGWVLDTQFIANMGSPYLLAHGMGRPGQGCDDRDRASGGGNVPRVRAHQGLGGTRGKHRGNRDDSNCWSMIGRSRRRLARRVPSGSGMTGAWSNWTAQQSN